MLTYTWNVNGEEAHSTFCLRFYGGSPSAEAFGEGGREGGEGSILHARRPGRGRASFFFLPPPLRGKLSARAERAHVPTEGGLEGTNRPHARNAHLSQRRPALAFSTTLFPNSLNLSSPASIAGYAMRGKGTNEGNIEPHLQAKSQRWFLCNAGSCHRVCP